MSEFDRSGTHALVSVMELDGALIVYETRTFEEVKRLPMSKPIGNYNVYNKITVFRRAPATSREAAGTNCRLDSRPRHAVLLDGGQGQWASAQIEAAGRASIAVQKNSPSQNVTAAGGLGRSQGLSNFPTP